MPIFPMTVYMILAKIKVFRTVGDMPFVYYIGMGMLIWLLMSTIIRSMLTAIKSEKAVLSTTSFPIFPILLSTLGEVLNDTFIRFIAVAGILVFYHIGVSIATIFLAILSLIPAIIFAMALGMIVSILNIIIRDTQRLVLIVLRYGIFISSVIFPFPETGIAGFINSFNFFNTFINATRDILYKGTVDHLMIFVCTSLVGILLFMLASKLVYTMDYKIREYL